VKVRQPSESYDTEVAALAEFTGLMVQRQINFSIEFFSEPPTAVREEQVLEEAPKLGESIEEKADDKVGDSDYQVSLAKLKEQKASGKMSREEYKSRKDDLLKKWKQKLEGRMEM
jgi:hypothetical protein